MIKVIIIDDENMSIMYLQDLLSSITGVEVIGTYQDGLEGLFAINKLNPDIVFLDIHMPILSGFEIAKKIIGKVNSKIVFTTADEKYALKAFDIGVFDYILKPYSKNRIELLIERVNNYDVSEINKDTYKINLFKQFHISKNNEEINNIKWRTSKSKELFIYLVQHEGEIVRKDILVEMLWPDLDTEHAYENLYTTIYNIRKTIKNVNLDIEIINMDHGYELKLNNVTCDVKEWENGIKKLNELLLHANITNKNEIIDNYKKIMKLYKGDYLAEETYIWAENEQERIRILFIDTAKKMIDYLSSIEEYTEAILLSLQLQDLYPYLDYSYFKLMQLYDEFGEIYNVERQYKKLIEMLNQEFNIKPNQAIQSWYHNWIKNQQYK